MSQSRRKPAARKSSSRPPIIPIVVAGIVLLGLIALVAASRGGDEGTDVAQTRPVQVDGDALPELTGGGSDPAVGQPIPEVTGEDFDGQPVSITREGQPKLVFFLAHWCPHCQDEVPIVTDWLADEGMPEGVELLSVSTSVAGNRPNYPPSEWLAEEDWPVPVLADDDANTVADAFGLSGFPFFVAVDGDGNVAARVSGALEVDQIEALVELARG